MNRSTAREIAVRLSYELSFTDLNAEALLDQTLTEEYFQGLAQEDPLYAEVPEEKQTWKFERIPLVASAIMRVAMYEALYMPDIPNAVAINEAVEIAKKYEDEKVVSFMNGILGSFVRQECGV